MASTETERFIYKFDFPTYTMNLVKVNLETMNEVLNVLGRMPYNESAQVISKAVAELKMLNPQLNQPVKPEVVPESEEVDAEPVEAEVVEEEAEVVEEEVQPD